MKYALKHRWLNLFLQGIDAPHNRLSKFNGCLDQNHYFVLANKNPFINFKSFHDAETFYLTNNLEWSFVIKRVSVVERVLWMFRTFELKTINRYGSENEHYD